MFYDIGIPAYNEEANIGNLLNNIFNQKKSKNYELKSIIVVSSGSITGWQNIRIKDRFEEEFRIPVRVDNDVNVAALGEHLFGAGKGVICSVFMVISTGVGFSIIKDGKILGLVLAGDIEKSGIIYNLMKDKVNVEAFKDTLVADDFGLASLPEEIWRKRLTIPPAEVSSIVPQPEPPEEEVMDE